MCSWHRLFLWRAEPHGPGSRPEVTWSGAIRPRPEVFGVMFGMATTCRPDVPYKALLSAEEGAHTLLASYVCPAHRSTGDPHNFEGPCRACEKPEETGCRQGSRTRGARGCLGMGIPMGLLRLYPLLGVWPHCRLMSCGASTPESSSAPQLLPNSFKVQVSVCAR